MEQPNNRKKNWFISFGKTIPAIVKAISDKDLFTQSAALSYYSALSLAPFMVLTMLGFSYFGPETEKAFTAQVQQVVGTKASEAILMIINASQANKDIRGISGILGVITLLISASAVFTQLKTTILAIFTPHKEVCEVSEPPQPWWEYIKERLFTIGMMISFIFLSLVSLMLSSTLAFLLPTGSGLFWQIVTFLLSFIIYTFVFFLVFKYFSSRRVSAKDSLIGGSLAAFLFVIGRSIISLYLVKGAVGSAYGAAGSLIVLLVWVYYSSFIVFVSGVITQHLITVRKIKDGKIKA